MIGEYLQLCVTAFEKFHLQVEDQARQTGKGLLQLTILQRQLEMYEQQVRVAAEEALTQITDSQREVNREFGPSIMNKMLEAYLV